MLNPARLQALETWQRVNQVTLSQVNGQRKYGGPPDEWEGPVPGSGCEVFISQIPREVYEDRLIPLFGAVGPLWEFRLMMNFSGMNRGFAYAKYGGRGQAAAAVRQLHGHQLEPGAPPLCVRHSTEKRQLCVGELPAATEWAELMQVLRSLSDGVESLALKSGPDIKGVSALVVYVSHYAASMAKKVLGEGFKKLFSLRVSVKWQHFHPKIRSPLPDRELPPRLRGPPPPAKTLNKAPAAAAPVSPGAVGTAPPLPAPPQKAPPCAVSALQRLCGSAPVLMNLEFTGVDPGGRVRVAYEVRLPGLPRPFGGSLSARLSASAEETMREVRQQVAGRVLAGLASQAW